MSKNEHDGSAPAVSVVIPAYNCGPYIAQAVGSALGQSFSNHEVIVVNDGSPDTGLLDSELRQFGDRIQYLKQPNRGPSAARNAGIRLARGQYVAFLDGDDYWKPEHLAKLMELFRSQPGLQLAYCDCVLLKNGKPFKRAFQVQPQATAVNFDSLLTEQCAMVTSSVMVSRDAAIAAGSFDESIRRCEDFDLWLRLAFGGSRISYQTDVNVVHRVSGTGLSSNTLAMKADRIRVYEKILTKLPVSEAQARTIRRIITNIEAESRIEEMKAALVKGDYDSARRCAAEAAERSQSWKLGIARVVLRVSPLALRWAYIVRGRTIGKDVLAPTARAHPATDTQLQTDNKTTSQENRRALPANQSAQEEVSARDRGN